MFVYIFTKIADGTHTVYLKNKCRIKFY